jgi:hypothetical protein
LTISTRQKAVHISRCLCRQYYANKTKKIANAYCWNGGKTVPRGTLILSREVERKTKGGGGEREKKKGRFLIREITTNKLELNIRCSNKWNESF